MFRTDLDQQSLWEPELPIPPSRHPAQILGGQKTTFISKSHALRVNSCQLPCPAPDFSNNDQVHLLLTSTRNFPQQKNPRVISSFLGSFLPSEGTAPRQDGGDPQAGIRRSHQCEADWGCALDRSSGNGMSKSP